MCGYECFISTKCIHSSLISWRDRYLKNLSIKYKMLKTEGLGEKKIYIYKTYKNTAIPHGSHIYAKLYDMAKAKICVYP